MRPSFAACTYYGHTYWQYRMHPALAAYPSAAFYGGRLTSGVSEEARPPPRGIAWPHADADGRGATPLAFLGVGDEAAQLPDLEAQVRWLSPLDHPYASDAGTLVITPRSPLRLEVQVPPLRSAITSRHILPPPTASHRSWAPPRPAAPAIPAMAILTVAIPATAILTMAVLTTAGGHLQGKSHRGTRAGRRGGPAVAALAAGRPRRHHSVCPAVRAPST